MLAIPGFYVMGEHLHENIAKKTTVKTLQLSGKLSRQYHYLSICIGTENEQSEINKEHS